jgi:hypothetical protein
MLATESKKPLRSVVPTFHARRRSRDASRFARIPAAPRCCVGNVDQEPPLAKGTADAAAAHVGLWSWPMEALRVFLASHLLLPLPLSAPEIAGARVCANEARVGGGAGFRRERRGAFAASTSSQAMPRIPLTGYRVAPLDRRDE